MPADISDVQRSGADIRYGEPCRGKAALSADIRQMTPGVGVKGRAVPIAMRSRPAPGGGDTPGVSRKAVGG